MKLHVFLWFILSCLISTYVLSDTNYKFPPGLSSEDIGKFDEWKQIAKEKKRDRVFVTAKGGYLNELVKSHSPYLRQHAKNPINWKPWRNDVLQLAKKKNKLIFLSIGYSTCHWCHVMEEESFFDYELAKIINENFIAIKVDREEQPDIDSYYASVLEAAKGTAGWPLTAVITGDGIPVFIDSYLPKHKLQRLLSRLSKLWVETPEYLEASGRNLISLVPLEQDRSETAPTIELLSERAVVELKANFDTEFGGLKGTIKFPQEAMLLFALDELRRNDDLELRGMIQTQLDNMLSGGISDHITGGFHRYSTDLSWNVPHFEKMLYNQALLSLVYLEAWDVFYDEIYKRVAKETIDFAVDHLYEKNAGFYSALDADFNNEEGGYYLWSHSQIDRFENLPGITTYQADSKGRFGVLVEREKLTEKSATFVRQLGLERERRGQLHRDDKVITAWNGLMIHALVKAADSLNDKRYLAIAKNVASKLYDQRYDRSLGLLFRTESKSQEIPHLEDYAYFSSGLISLFDSTGEPLWLERAKLIIESANSTIQSRHSFSQNVQSIRLFKDGELISPQAVRLSVIDKIDLRTGKTMNKEDQLPKVSTLANRANQSILSSLYSVKTLKDLMYGESGKIRYFAKGMGKLKIYCKEVNNNWCVRLNLGFYMKDGWHINSNQPIQDYLVPTSVESSNDVNVFFPKPKLVKLGFNSTPLSLYDRDFDIEVIAPGGNYKNRIRPREALKLNLQACNDSICLLPETLTIVN